MATPDAPSPLDLRRVRLLPEELANQIAAGEVVERPASAVRELVENALDAGATRVEVELEDGGATLIRVSDNGRGMSAADAELAIRRHATSKIAAREDLFAIRSYGFRGEALPSIASVSRFELVTSLHGQLGGTRVVVEGGTLRLVEPWSAAPGTVVTVRDLFFNTPARLKFLKTTGTELRNTLEAVTNLAAARPDVAFLVTHGPRRLLDFPVVDDEWSRIRSIVGLPDSDQLYYAPLAEQDGVTAWGFVGAPSLTRRSADAISIHVNGRHVRDRTLLGAVRTAYSTLVDRGRYPVVYLFLTLDPSHVDVNVHPAKTEVRFRDPQAVFRAARRSVANALAQSPWLEGASRGSAWATDGADARRPPAAPTDGHQSDVASWGAGDNASPGELHRSLPRIDDAGAVWGGGVRTYRLDRGDAPSSHRGGLEPPGVQTPPSGAGTPLAEAPSQQGLGERRFFRDLHYIGPLHNLYLLLSGPQGLVVIDQHAAHERVTFERLRAAWRARKVDVQAMLVPDMITLDALRAATLTDMVDALARLGFEIEPFGGNDFALKAVPAWATRMNVRAMIRDAIDDVASRGTTDRFEEGLDSVLSRMACHGSIRSGDSVQRDEVVRLLAELDEVDFGANCPHGRPVYFEMSLDELELRFERR